jgi:hypothetical protein
MLRRIVGKLLPPLGLCLVPYSGCIRSVCETTNDCPVGDLCRSGACVKPCTADTDCLHGEFCDRSTSLCATGCRTSADCANGDVCVQNQCWAMTSPVSSADGGQDYGGASACSCLQAPRACLEDINPASTTVATLVCEPGDPPRAAALFFGNVGCSHCQSIFGNLLTVESQLRSEGFDPRLVFVQIKTFTFTGVEVQSTFPTHTGPVLQDTDSGDMWGIYGADWYEVKIIDSHGCLNAFFTAPDTMSLISNGELQEPGKLLADAWREAMGSACHAVPDAGFADEVGP